MFGRRLDLPEINSGNGLRRSGAERQAINAPMQGTAADLIKLAMLAVQAELDAGQADQDDHAGARRTGLEVPEASWTGQGRGAAPDGRRGRATARGG